MDNSLKIEGLEKDKENTKQRQKLFIMTQLDVFRFELQEDHTDLTRSISH